MATTTVVIPMLAFVKAVPILYPGSIRQHEVVAAVLVRREVTVPSLSALRRWMMKPLIGKVLSHSLGVAFRRPLFLVVPR